MTMTRMISLLFLALFCLTGQAIAAGEFGPALPGSVEGVGSDFAVTESDFLNVRIVTSVEVFAYVDSRSGVVDMSLQAVEPTADADLTLSGLVPGATYYLYIDTLQNGRQLTAGSDGSLLIELDLTQPRHVTLQERHSTYFLSDVAWVDATGISHSAGWSDSDGNDMNYPGNPDGVGTWDPITRTATLVRDVYETIDWLANEVTLDGAGFSIYGSIPGDSYRRTGINMRGRYGNTVKNLNFYDCSYSLYLYQSYLNRIVDNRFVGNYNGPYLQWVSRANIVENNYIEGGHGGIQNNFGGFSNVIRNNTIVGVSSGIAFRLYATSCQVENNLIVDSRWALELLESWNTITGNTFENNEYGIYMPSSMNPRGNTIYRNNFVGNAIQATSFAEQNLFDQGEELGGNYWSDWTGPDLDGNGFVDVPYEVYDLAGASAGRDNYPWTVRDGWISNLPPVFEPVGEQSLSEYDLLQFTVTASDPDGDAIVSLVAQNLPGGASFDSTSGSFLWRPDGTQAGVYVVTFLATDDGEPAATGQLDVVLVVGEMTSPINATEAILETVAEIEMPSADLANSYEANLGKVETFISDGKVGATVNQLDAFIKKTEMDIQQGKLSPEDGARLIAMAEDVKTLLSSAD